MTSQIQGQKVFEAITSTGLSCARLAWPEGSAPNLPWCVYYLEEGKGLTADNKNYITKRRWVVEYYYKTFNQEQVTSLENAIANAFGPFEIMGDTWIEDENCAMIAYYFSEIG